MNLTKKTTMTWASHEDQYKPGLNEERQGYLEAEFAEGQTDNVPEHLSATVTVRKWVDQAAAERWKAFLEEAAPRWQSNLISVVIEDIS